MSEFSELLQRLRREARLSQGDVAARLGVSRPSATQWESGRHLPGADHIATLDELLGANGTLIDAAAADRRTKPRRLSIATAPATPVPPTGTSLTEVFARVGNRLRESVQIGDGVAGWSRLFDSPKQPSSWSTAIGLRTLQILDRADVDLSAIARWMADQQSAGGWADHGNERPRPEITIVVLDALSRLGFGASDLDASWNWLAGHFGDDPAGHQDRRRPFVLATVLDSTARVRPESRLVETLTTLLLTARTGRVWTARPTVPTAATSVAHTARAVNALRAALPVLPKRIAAEATDAVGAAVDAIVASDRRYDGVSLPEGEQDGGRGVMVSHFTSAHVLRTMAETSDIALADEKRETLLTTFWEAYLPDQRVWSWRIEGDLPIWMTLDAIIALRAVIASGQSVGPVPPLPAPPILNDEEVAS